MDLLLSLTPSGVHLADHVPVETAVPLRRPLGPRRGVHRHRAWLPRQVKEVGRVVGDDGPDGAGPGRKLPPAQGVVHRDDHAQVVVPVGGADVDPGGEGGLVGHHTRALVDVGE